MKNILIIEDEEKVIEVSKAYLEKAGYKVYIALTGLDGLEVFKTVPLDLVILDLMLPDISGEEICKVIRETSEVHIFMLTAKGSLEDRLDDLRLVQMSI